MNRAFTTVVNGMCSLRAGWRARRCARPGAGPPRVYYGFDRIPGPGEPAHGGLIKFQRMQADFPNSPDDYNIVYLLSSAMLGYAPAIAAAAHARGARVVWNQNGVAFPAWHGAGWERVNAPMKRILHLADHVFYQSAFCQRAADRYLGARKGAGEILYNPVDTSLFTPADRDPAPGQLVLLIAGSHEQLYRVRAALGALAALRGRGREARLILAGRMNWRARPEQALREARELAAGLGVAGHVDFRGAYTQAQAPALMREAHVLLHAKCNDPCPGLVLEALSCGLPVVYSDSGGTPELVGPDAGIGVRSRVTWETHEPPDPVALADAVERVMRERERFAGAARRRAVERFDLQPWLDRHRDVFGALIA